MPAFQKNFVVKNGLEVGRYGGEVIAALLESDNQPEPTYYPKVGIGTTTPHSTLEVAGDVKVSGNLLVSGTETIINTNVLEVEDINIGIASTSTKLSDSELNGAGITIHGSDGDKTLLWDSSDSKMSFNTDVYFPRFKGDFTGSGSATFGGDPSDIAGVNSGVQLRSSGGVLSANSGSGIIFVGKNSTSNETTVLITGDGSATFQGPIKTQQDSNSALAFAVTQGGTSNSDATIRFDGDGDAMFAGNIETGNYDLSATNNSGLSLHAGGLLNIQRPQSVGGGEAVFQGYYGSSTPTSRINADGSAEFAGGAAEFKSTGELQIDRNEAPNTLLGFYLNGVNKGFIRADGSSSFTSNVSVLGDGTERGKLDLYCESTGNPHYSRLIAPAHGNFTGNVTVVMPNSDGTLLLEDGSGANLTDLNADNLSSGTIPDARFPSVLPAVDGSQLLGVISGVSISDEGGTPIGGITTIDFRGSGVSAIVDVNSGIATVDVSGGGGGGSGNSTIEINTSAPFNPSPGDLWYSPDHARTFIYYDESAVGYGTNSYWIDASPFEIGTIDLTGVVGDINASGNASFGGTVDAAGFTINGVPLSSGGGGGGGSFDGNLTGDLVVSGNATFAGNIQATDGTQYAKVYETGFVQANRTNGNNYVFEGRLSNSTTSSINGDGFAWFNSNIQTGGDPNNASADGIKLFSTGACYASRSSGDDDLFVGYQTGDTTPATRLKANGSAEFASGDCIVTASGTVQVKNKTTNADAIQIWSGSTVTTRLNENGSATFAGTVDASEFTVSGNPVNGLQSRQVASVSETINANASSNISLTMAKTFALLTIESNGPCWVTLYADETSRTADATRNRTSSPFPGSGVLSEVIFTSAGKQLITPGTIGFSPDEQTTYYLKVVNDGSTGSVNLDFTYVPLEA